MEKYGVPSIWEFSYKVTLNERFSPGRDQPMIAGYLVAAGGNAPRNGPVKVFDRAPWLLSEQPGAGRHGKVDFLLSRSQENVQGIVTRRKTGTRGPRNFLQLSVSGDL